MPPHYNSPLHSKAEIETEHERTGMMKSLKEVLLDDLGRVLGSLFIIGLLASVVGIPYALAKYTGDLTWYWIYAAEAILFYILTIIYRMEREF